MIRVLLDDVVRTAYGQFTLEWLVDGTLGGEPDGALSTDHRDGDGDPLPSFAGQSNGWVGAAQPTLIHLVLARYGGGSGVRIEMHDGPPPDARGEDVVEVSTVVPVGARTMWLSWAGESAGDLELPDGSYRVRVSAWGRDEGAANEFAEGVVDRYLVQFWHDAPRPDEVLRTTSMDAAYWNSAHGSAPES